VGITDQSGAARPGVSIRTTVEIRGRERQARLPRPNSGELPAPNHIIHRSRNVTKEGAASAKRKFIRMVQVKNVEAYTIRPAIPDTRIPEEIAVLEIEGAAPSVISLKGHAVRESFFRAKLQGIEFYAGVVTEIFYGLSPAKLSGRTCRARFGKEKSALVGAESSETHNGWLVDVVIRASRGYVLWSEARHWD